MPLGPFVGDTEGVALDDDLLARNPKSGLTDKQQRFCEEYLSDFNATAAYLRAGYNCNVDTARSSAARLLTNASIQRYLAYLRDRVARRSEVTLERTVEELGRVAFSNITEALTFDGEGVSFRDSRQLPDSVTAAISSIGMTENMGESGVSRRQSLKMHNKVAALTLLADFFGIRDDFNKARATLKRYGLALLQDPESSTGWRLERYAPNRDDS